MIRGRFAPSPTGRLHLGNARTALLGWLQAKSVGGTFLLRIEDLDRARCRPEHTDTLLRDLEYLGLTWDETPWLQSQRTEHYDAALERLKRQGELYPCYCSRAEIQRAASAPHGLSDEGPIYPGTCRSLSAEARAERERTRRPALRFRPPPGLVAFDDLLHGAVHQDVALVVGDFVVRRNDGVASYQLAVVVDDAASDITDVLRADDLLDSTPRQLLLIRALGFAAPRYTHVPLVLGDDGKRLAKRSGPFSVTELREAGVPAQKVLGLLGQWCGIGVGAPTSIEDLRGAFRLEALPSEPLGTSETALRSLLGL